MMTRARSRTGSEEVEDANESFLIANDTILENVISEAAPAASVEQPTSRITSQLVAIVASIASLSECVKELRNDTQHLRDSISSESSNMRNVHQPPITSANMSSFVPQSTSGITFAHNISSPPPAIVATTTNLSYSFPQTSALSVVPHTSLAQPLASAAQPPKSAAQASTSTAHPPATAAQPLAQSVAEQRRSTYSYQPPSISEAYLRAASVHDSLLSVPCSSVQQPHASAHILQAALHATANVSQHSSPPAPTFMPQQHEPVLVQPTTSAPYSIESGVLYRAKLYPLPEFDGNPEDWPLFFSSFVDTTREFNYSDRQNLMRLQKALKGDAKRAVTSLLIFPENVQSILAELKFNFGRPELLIRSQLQKVRTFSNITEDHLEHILELSNQVRNITAFFKSARCEQHLVNPTLLEELTSKLPPSKQFEWSKHASTVTPFATVETFAEWVGNLAKIIAIMPKVCEKGSLTTTHRSSRRTEQRVATTRRFLHNSQQQTCVLCNQPHILEECPNFKTRNIENRWALVKRQRLCFSCLQGGHALQNCRKKKQCNLQGCQRVHHRLLHSPANMSVSTPATTNDAEVVLSCQGSSISLLEEDVANQLGLNGQSSPLTLQWYGTNTATEKSRIISLEVQGKNGSITFPLKNVRTVKSLNLPSQSFSKHQFPNLPIASYINVKPTLLLGLDNSFLGIANQTITKGPNQLIAARTKLGWLAYGPVDELEANRPRVLIVKEPPLSKKICVMVEEYLTQENLGVKAAVTEGDDDIRAKAILNATTSKIGDRYEVGLIWRYDDIVFPPSYDMAKKRLLGIEAKMKKNKIFADNYIRGMASYMEKGYARELSAAEVDNNSGKVWYLPHFGVTNPHKPGKLRIVFDAAAMTSHTSLNSELLKGPEQAQSLFAILHRFREGSVAVAGDIEEMFSQIRIRPDDQQAQRFLWRNGNDWEEIRIYAMTSMIFGAACSPCCAEYIKNINALQFVSDMPRGADAVMRNTYVDDLVISFNSEKEAETVTKEAIIINAAGGFKLRNFVSNNKRLQSRLNDREKPGAAIISMERQASVDKILGMFWNSEKDRFEFHFQFYKISPDILQCKRPPTKRELLAIVMSIYDPFGFLACTTIAGKLLIQAMWKKQIQWDEQLPKDLSSSWTTWWARLQTIKTLSVPRCYGKLLPVAEEVEVHIFVDASSTAYAAVAYLRMRKADKIHVAFICAKSRCAPVKGMTIPRLELQAAILGCRLKTFIAQNHDFHIRRFILWSDSQTVIMWIRSKERKFKPFVEHRIAEILTLTNSDMWRWLPSHVNVADDATRATLTQCSSHRWFTGPEFLQRGEQYWPHEPDKLDGSECSLEEAFPRILLLCQTGELIQYTNYSSFLKIVRVVAWILRFASNTRRHSRQRGELTAAEVREAEKYICRDIQRGSFQPEIILLKNRKPLPKSSCLHKLTPLIDEDYIVRVSGRIDSAYCLPLTARRPIILPQNHYVTRLIMEQFHIRNHHQNDHLIINEMRQKYWVPSARKLLKSIKRACPVCIRWTAEPAVPLMGQLPTDRLTPFVRPFSYAGVDYCGPFFVMIARRTEKRWVVLFTCMTTRAIHLEVAEDLSTDSFIICLRNFVNRRGVPVQIRSDNGTNFVGAQRELKSENKLFDFERIDQEMARQNIEWRFNCPANPNAGGCWERLIQCVKKLLQRVLKEDAPRVETFRSVLIEAENIVNSRPLTEIPISPDDEEPLTPNHFLIGCVNSTQTPSLDEVHRCPRKQWKIAQNLKDRIWKRWMIEYLPQLLCRPKWTEEADPLKLGQLVIVCDPALPRSRWEMGKVVEVFPGKDGRIRSAAIQTSHGVMRRPTSKLAALRFRESAEDSPVGGMS